MKTSYKNFNSKFLHEESVRKLFVSSLSVPTFLAQSMGYLSLSFNKSSNSLQFKILSLPMLSFIFHSALSLTWICVYVIQNIVIMSAGSNKKASSSATVSSTSFGIMALATIGTSAIRIYCLFKYKEIISFYEQLKSIISNVLLNSPKVSIDKKFAYWSSKMNAKGSCTPIRSTISVLIIFIAYASIVIVSQVGNQQNQSSLWQLFESLALVCACVIASLYSALIIWLSQIVYLIRLGFKGLEDCGAVSWDGDECFARRFLELRELVKIVNSLFDIPMMISLGGLSAYGIIFEFFLLEIWNNASLFPLATFLTGSTVMICIIFICFYNFW